MGRNPVRDERQGDRFGAPPPPAQPARRTFPPMMAREEVAAPEPLSLIELGKKVTKSDIDQFMGRLPDQGLAYLAAQATRLVKRRLTRGQGRGLQPKGANKVSSPLDDALHRIAGELMEIEDLGETW